MADSVRVEVVVGCAVLAALYLPFLVLTALGAARRGRGRGVALAEGLVFPATWVWWYYRDRTTA